MGQSMGNNPQLCGFVATAQSIGSPLPHIGNSSDNYILWSTPEKLRPLKRTGLVLGEYRVSCFSPVFQGIPGGLGVTRAPTGLLSQALPPSPQAVPRSILSVHPASNPSPDHRSLCLINHFCQCASRLGLCSQTLPTHQRMSFILKKQFRRHKYCIRLCMRKLAVPHKPLYLNRVIKMIINSPTLSTVHTLNVMIIINLLTSSTVYTLGNAITKPQSCSFSHWEGIHRNCARLKGLGF